MTWLLALIASFELMEMINKIGHRSWRFGSILRERRQSPASVLGGRPLPPQYTPLFTFNVQPPLNLGLEAILHMTHVDGCSRKRDTHVLDDPGFVNSFEIRKYVRRSQLLISQGTSVGVVPATFFFRFPGHRFPPMCATTLLLPNARLSLSLTYLAAPMLRNRCGGTSSRPAFNIQ